MAVLRHPALPAVCRELAAIAEAHFADSARAMAQCRRRAMRPAAVMSAVYHATLRELLRGGWRDPAARVSLSKPRKLWLVLRHGSGMSGRFDGGRVRACRRRRARRVSPPRSQLAAAGAGCALYEASDHAGGRCRSYFDRRARLPHRQRQPSAARRQPRGARTISNRSARSTRSRDRSEAVFAFVDAGERASAGSCGRIAARVPWWILRRGAAGAGHPRARLSRGAGAALRRPVGNDRRGARSASAGCFAGCGSRSPSPR